MLQAQQLQVSLGRQAILHEVSFEAQPGQVTALLGPNGSGKTTLLKTLAGLLPARGQLQWQGQPLPLQGRQLHATCGYLPQDCSTRSRLTVAEAVLLGRLGSLGWRVHAEHGSQHGGGEDVAGCAGRHHTPVLQQQNVVGVGQRSVQVVQYHHGGELLLAGLLTHGAHHLHLVLQVQRADRLVQ